jgi:hypothetical protein
MSALTDKLKKQARALIPRFYREYKGASDWWHSVRVDGKDYDLNFLTHDPDGTGAFKGKFKYAVRVVAYKDGIDGKSIRLGFFNGMNRIGKTFYKNRRQLYKNPFSRESDRMKGYDDDRDEIPDKPLFKSGGYAVVITFKSGEVQIGQGISQDQAERQRKYLMNQYARLKLTRGINNVLSIEVLPVTSVSR